MSVHLTMTGVYAGQPVCGAVREGQDDGVHLIYAPLDRPEFRATVCLACLKAFVNSYEPEELAHLAPDHWVRLAAEKPADTQGKLL